MSIERSKTFVLVHGAWHGGWCWRRVADILTKAGHKAFTPTLTALGERSHVSHANVNLSTHVTDIVNVLKWERLSNVILCGHSYGGFVIAGVAEKMPDAIAALAFIDAFVPESGDTVARVLSSVARQHVDEAMRRGEAIIAPIPAAIFGVNEKDRAWVDALCTPQPLATFTEQFAFTSALERIAGKFYVRARGYASPSFDRALAAVRTRPSWRSFELACGHDIMVDMPQELADILLTAAKESA